MMYKSRNIRTGAAGKEWENAEKEESIKSFASVVNEKLLILETFIRINSFQTFSIYFSNVLDHFNLQL